MCHLRGRGLLVGTTLSTTLSTLNRNSEPRLSHKSRLARMRCWELESAGRPLGLYFLSIFCCSAEMAEKVRLRLMDLLLFHLERSFEWINFTTSIIIRWRARSLRAVSFAKRAALSFCCCLSGVRFVFSERRSRLIIQRVGSQWAAFVRRQRLYLRLNIYPAAAALQVLMQQPPHHRRRVCQKTRPCVFVWCDYVFTCAARLPLCGRKCTWSQMSSLSRPRATRLTFHSDSPGANCSRPLLADCILSSICRRKTSLYILSARNLNAVPLACTVNIIFLSCGCRNLWEFSELKLIQTKDGVVIK